MPKLKTYLIPLTVFLFSFFLRLSLISKGPYHIDTLGLVIESQKIIEHHRLSYAFGPGYILSAILGALFILGGRLFSIHDPVLCVNFISVLFSSLSLLVFYFLVKKLFDSTAALVSALLLDFCPIFLGLSIYEKSHMPCLFFLLTALLFLINFLNKNTRKDLLLSGLFFGLMGSTRMQDMILMIPAVSFLLLFYSPKTTKRPSLIKSFGIFFATTLSTLIVFFLPLILEKDKREFIDLFSSFWSSGMTENFRGFFSPSLLWAARYLLENFLPLGIIWVIGGLTKLTKNSRRLSIFLWLWFLFPLSFYGNLYSTVPRFLMISFVPLIIAEGYMICESLKKNVQFRLVGFFTFFLTLYLSFAGICPLLVFRHQFALLPDFAREVSQNTENNAKIITGDYDLFITYYGNRSQFQRPFPSGYSDLIEPSALFEFKKELDKNLDEGTPIYITSSGLYAYDPDKQFSTFFKTHYDLELIGRHLAEDWHAGETAFQILRSSLFKIEKK